MTIKLLQWNIWLKEHPDNIIKVLKALDPDIFCLQELNAPIAKTINGDLGNLNYYYRDVQTWSDRSQGNAIFSKFPIKARSFSYLQDPATRETNHNTQGRVYLETELEVGSKTLIVATTHLSHEPTFVDSQIKLEELAKLEKIIKNKSSSFVLVADFNALPTSKLVKNISNHLVNLGPDLALPTWDTKPKSASDKNKLTWRLDYIFGTEDIEVVKSEIIETEYSDHLPVLVEIRI